MAKKGTHKSRGPFPFAQVMRDRIVALNLQDWECSRPGTSLKVKFNPIGQDIRRILKVSVNAQYWVGRQPSGQPPRVSFEFSPRVPAYPTICSELAPDFRAFLSRRGIPQYCVPSDKPDGQTVLHVPVEVDSHDEVISVDVISKALGLFTFVQKNIGQWHKQRLTSLLQSLVKSDALDDLESHRSSYDDLPQTEREDIRKSRIGQGKFRQGLIKYWETCAISDLGELLILRASHIKPWRVSDNRERLDPFNGLLLAPNFDALFDAGLISFDVTGQILVSTKLSAADQRRLGISKELKLRCIEEAHKQYLYFHRRQHGFDE